MAPLLSFSGLSSDRHDDNEEEDTEMKDVSPVSADPPMIEIPLQFDFDLDLDDVPSSIGASSHARPEADPDSDFDSSSDALELRSPRTPTYKGPEGGNSSSPSSPFDPERFFKFPLLSPTGETSSPLMRLSTSPAATSYTDLHHHHHSHHNIYYDAQETLSPPQTTSTPRLPPRPQSPLRWLWTCHLCRSRYPLGATRRCLVDGHFYCSGGGGDNNNNSSSSKSSTQRNVKRKKRAQSCSSEFDYAGWRDWSAWRREVIELKRRTLAGTGSSLSRKTTKTKIRTGTEELTGCEECEYPSQCRYERINKVPEIIASIAKRAGGNMAAAAAAATTTTGTKDTGAGMGAGTGTGRRKKTSEAKELNTSKKNLKIDTAISELLYASAKNSTNEKTATMSSDSAGAANKVSSPQSQSHTSSGPPVKPSSSLSSSSLSEVTASGLKSNRRASSSSCCQHPSQHVEGDQLVRSDLQFKPSVMADSSGEREVVASAAAVVAAESPLSKAASIGLPRLVRTKSRKKDSTCETIGLKQSRISDFFGMTR